MQNFWKYRFLRKKKTGYLSDSFWRKGFFGWHVQKKNMRGDMCKKKKSMGSFCNRSKIRGQKVSTWHMPLYVSTPLVVHYSCICTSSKYLLVLIPFICVSILKVRFGSQQSFYVMGLLLFINGAAQVGLDSIHQSAVGCLPYLAY